MKLRPCTTYFHSCHHSWVQSGVLSNIITANFPHPGFVSKSKLKRERMQLFVHVLVVFNAESQSTSM